MTTQTANRFIIGTNEPGASGEVWFVQDTLTRELIDQNLTQSEARVLAGIQNDLESELDALTEALTGEGNQTLAQALSGDLKAASEDLPSSPHRDNRRENFADLAASAPSEAGRAFWAAKLVPFL